MCILLEPCRDFGQTGVDNSLRGDQNHFHALSQTGDLTILDPEPMACLFEYSAWVDLPCTQGNLALVPTKGCQMVRNDKNGKATPRYIELPGLKGGLLCSWSMLVMHNLPKLL